MGTYGTRIDKLGKMIWSQFSTKVLQVTILDIDDWYWIRVNQYSKEKSSLEQNSSLHNQIYIHDIINPKYLKKDREKNFEFSQK